MANGPDIIPCRILKEAATEIAPFLKLLFTQSMESGIMPNDWLKANITPVQCSKLTFGPGLPQDQ